MAIVNEKIGMMRSEAAVSYFQILSQHLPGETEKNHKDLSQGSPLPGQESNPGPYEFDARLPSPQPLR
jgi:hypothetical protein